MEAVNYLQFVGSAVSNMLSTQRMFSLKCLNILSCPYGFTTAARVLAYSLGIRDTALCPLVELDEAVGGIGAHPGPWKTEGREMDVRKPGVVLAINSLWNSSFSEPQFLFNKGPRPKHFFKKCVVL